MKAGAVNNNAEFVNGKEGRKLLLDSYRSMFSKKGAAE
jgi:hypothetical protein